MSVSIETKLELLAERFDATERRARIAMAHDGATWDDEDGPVAAFRDAMKAFGAELMIHGDVCQTVGEPSAFEVRAKAIGESVYFAVKAPCGWVAVHSHPIYEAPEG